MKSTNHSETLTALADLAALTSHDLASPVTTLSFATITLQSQLSKGPPAVEKITEYLQKVERCVSRMSSTVKAVRALSNVAYDKTESKFSVKNLFEEAHLMSFDRLRSANLSVSGIESLSDRNVECSFGRCAYAIHRLIRAIADATKHLDSPSLTVRENKKPESSEIHFEYPADAEPIAPDHLGIRLASELLEENGIKTLTQNLVQNKIQVIFPLVC